MNGLVVKLCCAFFLLMNETAAAAVAAAAPAAAEASASEDYYDDFNRCAHTFSVCGDSQGVDFRSHFSVYGSQHGLSGWVRNACNGCVYG